MRMNDIFEIFLGIFKTAVVNFFKFICNNYVTLINLFLIIFPAGLVYYYTKMLEWSLIIVCYQLFAIIVKKFFEIIKNEKDGFPVLNKRLTIKRNNEVTIKQGCLQEAIIYLSQVEDYTERCGYIKK